MASPTVFDEDFAAYVHSAAINQPGTATGANDASARAAIAAILQAIKAKWQIGRDPLTRTCSLVKASSVNATSADASFTQDDVGATISGTGLPGGTTIATVTNVSTIVLSQAASSSTTDAATIAKTDAGAVSRGAGVWNATLNCYSNHAAIASPSGGTTDAELRTAVGQVLTALRQSGVILGGTAGGPTVFDPAAGAYTFSAYTAPTGGTPDNEGRTAINSIATALKSKGLLKL